MTGVGQRRSLATGALARIAIVALGVATLAAWPRGATPDPASTASSVLFREDFEAGLGERWVERSFPSIDRKNTFTLRRDADGNGYLHVESHDSYSARGVQLRFSAEQCAQVCWRWRIGGVVDEGDLERRDGDDAAAKLYVVFDGPSFWNPFDKRALVYLWDNVHPRGTIVPNAWAPARERMIVLESGNRERGRWVRECVDLAGDYARAFPGERPGRVEGIAFLADTDNTHARASASLDDLTVCCMPRPAPAERE
ncbi:MAG: DUF3047 domain-containing protein [Myxococcota bacterium]